MTEDEINARLEADTAARIVNTRYVILASTTALQLRIAAGDIPRSGIEHISLGMMSTVGVLDGRPIVVDVTWQRVHGELVAFVEPTSELVDWRAIDKWLAVKFPRAPVRDESDLVRTVAEIRKDTP